jgi:dipeptidyl-peptidase-4
MVDGSHRITGSFSRLTLAFSLNYYAKGVLVRKVHLIFSVMIVLCTIVPLKAQVQPESMLTLDRIFKSREFAGDRFGPARWLDNGSSYTTVEPSEAQKGARDIVKYDAKTGKREILVSAAKLVPQGEKEPLSIEDYAWSPDGKLLLLYTNSKRVWRENTRGDYWVINLAAWSMKKLGGSAEPSTLMFAKFSPDGKKVGYVREHNLYAENLDDGKITQLTNDGSTTIINGTFDWVYEEEWDARDGFRWSPDSKLIAYWQLDACGVRDFYLINDTDSLYSYIIPVQYPKVGTTLSACKVGVVNADGGATTWMNVSGDTRNNYIPRMEWADNSREIVFQHMDRAQHTDQVMLGDASTGAVRTVLSDSDTTWFEIVDDLQWFDKGKRFSWVSEDDGWRHVYMVSRDGKEKSLVTPGDYDVVRIVRIDEDGEWMYFIASPDNATQRYLFRVRMNGKGKMERITPVNEPGFHSYGISPNGKWAFHTFSSFDSPQTIELVSLPNHKVVRTLVDNAKLRENLKKIAWGKDEFFKVDIGNGVSLDGWMMKPSNFDPTKKYPVLVFVYGEPAAQTVLDAWSSRNGLWHEMLTQQGYVVLSVDNHGTPAPRGRAWRKSIYRQIGILASKDQAAAIEVIRTWPFVDSIRIGIWGWSGGGSMTLNMMCRYPELYQTGMAVAPVPDQHLYDATYQERYMDLLENNEDGYRLGSPITYAGQLKGNLLIVHGSGDDNVHFQGTERMINALIKANKPFTMMAYPNRSHGIFEGENTTIHVFNLLTRYLHQNLPAGPR